MAILNFISAIAGAINEPTDFWGMILNSVFSFVENYGWRIVVFTICLKLILSPLDIYQRVKMRKNQKITERIKPELEKLQMQYGTNKQVLQQKQMELNKREGFSYMSACLPMLVTIVIFFWLLSGLQSMSQYMTFKQYVELYDVYQGRYSEVKIENHFEWRVVIKDGEEAKNENGDTLYAWQISEEWKLTDEYNSLIGPSIEHEYKNEEFYANAIGLLAEEAGQQAVFDEYHAKYKVGFGIGKLQWIKNVWSPDVTWESPIMKYNSFVTNIGKYGSDTSKSGMDRVDLGTITSSSKYETVMRKLLDSEDNKQNGWFVLPVLCVGFSFLSQFITSRQQRKSGQAAAEGSTMAGSMKMMMFIMPFIMGFFALRYTSVFTLYIITNSIMTLLLNLITTSTLVLIDKKRDERVLIVKDDSSSASDTKSGKNKKAAAGKTSGKDVVIRYGRPDPNDKNNDKK